MPDDVSFIDRVGRASVTSTATTPRMTSTGRRCTPTARREKKPTSDGLLDCLAGQAFCADDAECRHERDGDDHRDEDDADAGHADGAHDRRLEDEQAGEGDRDGEPGEEDGAAGRRHGPLGGVGDLLARRHLVLAVGELLAEAAHREQAVVDGEAEAEQGDDVDDGRVELDDVREDEEREQGPADRDDGPDDRHARGDEAAEDEEHDDEGERQGDALAPEQVALDGAS